MAKLLAGSLIFPEEKAAVLPLDAQECRPDQQSLSTKIRFFAPVLRTAGII